MGRGFTTAFNAFPRRAKISKDFIDPSVFSDPRRFFARLKLQDERGKIGNFDWPHDEQLDILYYLEPDVLCEPIKPQDLLNDEDYEYDGGDPRWDYTTPNIRRPETLVVLKCRQIGGSTVNCAHTFWKTYTSRDPIRTLVVAHENGATDAIFSKIAFFHESLPGSLHRATERSNRKELVFDSTKAAIRCMTAGGYGQGRAWTYQRLVAEELAYWPNPAATWASATSTLHKGEHRQIVVISTPNGPGDRFHEMVGQAEDAQNNGDWRSRLLFFKWSDHRSYVLEPPPEWAPNSYEEHLQRLHALSDEQIYWYHNKCYGVDGIGVERVKREYPLTQQDGFLVVRGGWFDVSYLNDLLAVRQRHHRPGNYRLYHKPEKGEKYFIGVDPSWCTGGDFAVAQVIDARGRQCYVFSTNTGSPESFARIVADLSRAYNNAKVLAESNTGGAGYNVNKVLIGRKINIWKGYRSDDDHNKKHAKSEEKKYWWTTSNSKSMVYSHGRTMINGDAMDIYDVPTIKELQHIREENGTIAGRDGRHDDHSDALVLAEWCRWTSVPRRMIKPREQRRSYTVKDSPFNVLRSGRRNA